MLNDAASSAKPKKYAQNNGHGIYVGTMDLRESAAARCRAPKTAKGAAKHKLLNATILSRPWARSISVFAAKIATTKRTTPAVHIEDTVRENSRNAAKMIACMWIRMPSASSFAVSRHVSQSIQPQTIQRRVGENGPDALTDQASRTRYEGGSRYRALFLSSAWWRAGCAKQGS